MGVCRPNIKLEGAFSDTVNGWGIYNGELRHNSNSTGQKYGAQLKSGDTIAYEGSGFSTYKAVNYIGRSIKSIFKK